MQTETFKKLESWKINEEKKRRKIFSEICWSINFNLPSWETGTPGPLICRRAFIQANARWKAFHNYSSLFLVLYFIAFLLFNYSTSLNESIAMLPQQYCLRWKYHHSNLQTMFSQLLDRGCFCDVTLACDGQTLKAHRVVLSACSTYFDSILTNCNSEKDPIIILKDVKFMDIKYLVEFMYKGEINVEHVSWQKFNHQSV